jgi:hypothetical protein
VSQLHGLVTVFGAALTVHSKHEVLDKKHVIFYRETGLGLGQCTSKKWGPPSPRAGVGQENIATVHEPEPTQTASSP